MKRTVGFSIYLPPQYEKEPNRRFPVVYFLHGATGTESSDTGLARYVDAAIASGRIAPVIYVFPNGGAGSYYRDWPENYVRAETMLVRELLPFVDQHYRTIDRSPSRGICGFSMGGSGAIRLVLKYPGLFCTAAALAGAIDKAPEDFGGDNCYRHASALTQKQRESLYLLMVIGGDDFLLPRQEPEEPWHQVHLHRAFECRSQSWKVYGIVRAGHDRAYVERVVQGRESLSRCGVCRNHPVTPRAASGAENERYLPFAANLALRASRRTSTSSRMR